MLKQFKHSGYVDRQVKASPTGAYYLPTHKLNPKVATKRTNQVCTLRTTYSYINLAPQQVPIIVYQPLGSANRHTTQYFAFNNFHMEF